MTKAEEEGIFPPEKEEMMVLSRPKPPEEKDLASLLFGGVFRWVWEENPPDDVPVECRECGGGLLEKVLPTGDREFTCSCGWRWRG